MTTDPTSLGSAAEYQVTIDFGGRDGVHGIEKRNLGQVSEERALEHAAMMIRDHARRVSVERREAGEWTTIKVIP
jgi:hypothetical protein